MSTPFTNHDRVSHWLTDARDIQQRLAAHAAKDIGHAYYRWLAERLLEKLEGAQAALNAIRGNAQLDGGMSIGLSDEREAQAPALTFDRIANERFIEGMQEQTR